MPGYTAGPTAPSTPAVSHGKGQTEQRQDRHAAISACRHIKDLNKLKPGKTKADHAVRWLAQPQGVYAQWRGRHPVTGKWQSVRRSRSD